MIKKKKNIKQKELIKEQVLPVVEAQKSDHCCNLMRKRLEDKAGLIRYDRVHRRYIMVRRYTYWESTFFFCPWCGNELPSCLRNEFYEILKEKHQKCITFPDLTIDKEFKSDEWWKKRGL